MDDAAIHRRAFRGGLVAAMNFALNLLLNVLQVWVLLRWWSRDTYGLWLSVVAASTLLTTFDAGHLAFVGNKMTAEWVRDREALRRTLGSAVRMVLLTACLQIAITAWLCATGRVYAVLSLDPHDAQGFAGAVVIYTVGWIANGSLASIIVRLMPAGGFFVRATLWGMAVRTIQFATLVVAAYAGWSLPGVALFYQLIGVVVGIFFYADIWKLFPDLTPWWREGDLRTGLRNLAKSTVLTVTGFLDNVTLQGVLLFVTSVFGAAIVPLFTTLRTMANMALQGTSFLLQPILPDLIRFHVNREPRKLAAVFQFFWLSSGLLFNAGMVAALLVVEPVYRIWTQGKLEFHPALFAWLAASVLIRSWGAPLSTLIGALNWLRAQALLSSVRTGITAVVTLALYRVWGLAGIGAALAAAELAASLLLPAILVRAEFVRLRGAWPARHLAVAGLSTFTALAALSVFARNPDEPRWYIGVALCVLVSIALWQWTVLPADLRARVLSLVPRSPR